MISQVPSEFWGFRKLEELDMSHNLLGSSHEMGTFNLIYFGRKLKKVSMIPNANITDFRIHVHIFSISCKGRLLFQSDEDISDAKAARQQENQIPS